MQSLLWCEGDRMDDEIQLSPILRDALEHRLHLSRNLRIEGHDYFCIKFARQRFNVLLCFVIEIRDGQLRAQSSKCRGAPPCDRLLICDTDNQSLLPLEEFR